jgi:hypothetical protein
MTTPDPLPDATPQPTTTWSDFWIALALILIGSAVRIRDYLGNRSLGRDEAALAINFLNRSFLGIFKPLDQQQAAPVGFLLIQKIAAALTHTSELGLRFIPLLASIAALFLFWQLCKLILPSRAMLFALGILALNYRQYYYAQEIKQYSTDVCIAVGLMFLAVKILGITSPPRIPTRRELIILASVGAVAIWFSHPSIFILAGIFIMTLSVWHRSPNRNLDKLFLVALAWAVSFALHYFLILRPLSRSDYMQAFWFNADAFGPLPKSLGSIIWYKKSFFELFEDPLGLEFTGIAALAFILGFAVLSRRRLPVLLLLVTPILFVLLASILHQYPFKSRMILFIVPSLAAVIGAGLDWLFEDSRRCVGIAVLILLAISPVTSTVTYAISTPQRNDIRSSIAYAGSHSQPGDIDYVYPYCQYGFDYYKSRFGLRSAVPIVGTQDVPSWDAYTAELSKLSNHRVWVFFEDTTDHGGINDQQMALHILDTLGKRVDAPTTQPFGEYVACYDLRRQSFP